MGQARLGLLYGFLGVFIFSGSLPATRLALTGFDPYFLTAIRAIIAGGLAFACLLLTRQRLPSKNEYQRLIIVALGCVVGFPVLTALALGYISSARSLVFAGLLPLSTALWSAYRHQDRHSVSFWCYAIAGASIVILYALSQSGSHASLVGDFYMLLAIIVCGLGYAEGAVLTRNMGGWQTISWALVISLPFMLVLAWLTWPHPWHPIGQQAWYGLFYVALFSMFIGFVFWYQGLARGGVASVGQLQLLQPFMGFVVAAIVVGEQITMSMMMTALLVMICIWGARRQSAK